MKSTQIEIFRNDCPDFVADWALIGELSINVNDLKVNWLTFGSGKIAKN